MKLNAVFSMSSTKTKRQKSIVTVSQVFKVQYKKYTKILVHLCMCVCVCKCVGVLQVEKCISFAFFASLLFCTQRVPMSIFIFDVNICIEERH